MSRIRLLALATTIFVLALTAPAQQAPGTPSNIDKDSPVQHSSASDAEAHLRVLSENLSLTAEQQDKMRPILQNMLEERQKLMHDQSLSAEQREEKQRTLHDKADREARKFLNQEQKKKLDELEAQHRSDTPEHAHP